MERTYEFVHVRFEAETVDALRLLAKADDRPISNFVRLIVTRHLDANPPEQPEA